MRHERATARNDVARKCKLQTSFYFSTNMLGTSSFLPFWNIGGV